jgi:glycosyltransferase involved in cell wall biosynthesis
LRIAYFILNSFDYDSRARLEVETLTAMGHKIEIFAAVGGESDLFQGQAIHRISQWKWPSRKIRFVQYNLMAALIAKRLRPDICHAIDLDTLQAAIWVAKAAHGRVVYEARELYTELESLKGRFLVRRAWQLLEKRLVGRASRIITINNSIADQLCSRYGIERPTVIRNTAPVPHSLKPVDLHALFNVPENWKILIYQGVLRPGQGLMYLLDILKLTDSIGLVFVGRGVLESEIKQRVAQLGISGKVWFSGLVKPDILAGYTAGADAGVLLMEDVALNNELALPQKLFQYLVCGAPQIVSPMPEMARFVESERTGIVVPLGDAPAAAAKISEFLFDAAAFAAAKECCHKSATRNNWETESIKLVQLYRSLGADS